MAVPHVEKLTRILIGSNLVKATNVDYDVVQNEVHSNNDQLPYAMREQPLPGGFWSKFNFDFKCAGSGTAGTPPVDMDALKACGLVYINAPATSDIFTVTRTLLSVSGSFSNYLGKAYLQTCTAALGNVSWAFRKGQPVIATYNMLGAYVEPTEAVDSTGLATSARPVACKGMTIDVNGDTLVIREVDINLAVEVMLPERDDLVAATGKAAAVIVDMIPTMRILAEMPLLATANYHAGFTAGTVLDCQITNAGAAGNIIDWAWKGYQNTPPRISAPKLGLVELNMDMGWGSGEELVVTYT